MIDYKKTDKDTNEEINDLDNQADADNWIAGVAIFIIVVGGIVTMFLLNC